MGSAPNPALYTVAPLRNRIRVDLAASVADVWELMGDLRRFPEYSAGLERVDVETDGTGALEGYVCHFKPRQQGGEPIAHREVIRWYEPERGYASTAAEPELFGQSNALAVMTLEACAAGTRMTYDMYYDAVDLAFTTADIDQAFADIGARLVARFGGGVVEHDAQAGR